VHVSPGAHGAQSNLEYEGGKRWDPSATFSLRDKIYKYFKTMLIVSDYIKVREIKSFFKTTIS